MAATLSSHELIFRQISPLGNPATQSMTSSSHEKCGCTQMPNSNDVTSNEMLWERVLSLLVVGACVLGEVGKPDAGNRLVRFERRVADTGVTTNPSRISIVAERVLSGRRAKSSVERNVQQYVQHENKAKT